ncbi:hypothetical protein GCM10029992_47140 [Glycomyces albus]
MTESTVLSMRGIDKSFLGVRVLRSVDLDVRPGEVHALVGENGAGKSTLMKILAGVHTADAGTITLGGRAVSFTHPSRPSTPESPPSSRSSTSCPTSASPRTSSWAANPDAAA